MSDIKIPCSNLDTLKSYLLCVPAKASGNAPAPLLWGCPLFLMLSWSPVLFDFTSPGLLRIAPCLELTQLGSGWVRRNLHSPSHWHFACRLHFHLDSSLQAPEKVPTSGFSALFTSTVYTVIASRLPTCWWNEDLSFDLIRLCVRISQAMCDSSCLWFCWSPVS